jgi:phospholipid/cholesterol/gamma-HCH transport system substrate-binding protein
MTVRRSIVTLTAVALLAAGCSLPGRTTGPIELTAVFDDVGDLVVNHSVQVADVRVGSVTSIELTDDYKAKVTISIQDIKVPRDSEALLRTTSLLGEKFIELRPKEGVEPGRCPCLEDGDSIDDVRQAPELEFVAEQAVQLLGGVATNDLVRLIETGAVGFGGRGVELRALVDELSLVSGTLADQTDRIVQIIDGLDQATSTLAAADPDVDALLVNLADATSVLAEHREQAIVTLRELTRLARDQNELVFDPYLDTVDRQIKELDAIVAEVAAARGEVSTLVDWLASFVVEVQHGIPTSGPAEGFAQVYGWLIPCGVSEDC